jgi:Tat protein secretion system quality control protein TatD with DNase activity
MAQIMVLTTHARRLTFDAHNHIHLSLPGGIPPLVDTNSYGAVGASTKKVLGEHGNAIRQALHLDLENEQSDLSSTTGSARTKDHAYLGGMALMSTQPRDFPIVESLSKSNLSSSVVVSCFGVHPWFLPQANQDFAECTISRTTSDEEENDNDDDTKGFLLEYFSEYNQIEWLSYLKETLTQNPTSHVGEIGLDGARYDPITKDLVCPMDEQVLSFEAQMHLAADRGLSVSVHAVRCWGPLMDSMRNIKQSRNRIRKEKRLKVKRSVEGDDSMSGDVWLLPPKIYFHAFGGKAAVVDQLDAICRDSSKTFYGFAPVINFRSPKTKDLIRKVGIERLVLESDLEDYSHVMEDLESNILFVADALSLDMDAVLEQTFENARRLYCLN